MSQENGTATLILAPSLYDVDIQDPSKRSKISYTKEFLLSLDKADKTAKLPMEAQLLISCMVRDASGILSPPLCVPDSRCQKSVSQNFSLKVLDDVNQLLHRSNEPYRPPCRNVDAVSAAKDDKWHSSKNADLTDSLDESLISPAARDLKTLQFASNLINKQLDASCKSSQIPGAVRGDAGLSSTLPETAENCSTQCQQVQDLTTNGAVNSWLKTVNYADTSWHLSMLDNGMHLMESEESLNFDVEHPEGTAHVIESRQKSKPASLLNQENCGNPKNNHGALVYEHGLMQLQLSNRSVCVHGSPGDIARSGPSEAYISPTSVEEEIQFASSVDNCESATVYCKGISVSMKQNPSSPDFQIHQKLELNSFSGSSDKESNSSSELCLPDEDSLLTFDEPFLILDLEKLVVVDNSPERNPIKSGVFSPSSPREMVEKLVEFVLNDESSPTPPMDDPLVQHGDGMGGLFYPMHAQKPYTPFCSSQLNPGRDQQDHNSLQRNSTDSGNYSFFSHSFPSNTFSQPFTLYHDELRRFDHEVSQSTFQQMINPDLGSLRVSQSGVPPHLPALQMASCTQRLNSMQSCTFGYQEPNYGKFIKPNLDFHGDSNINQALVDSFIDMKLQASHWHPHLGAF